MVLTISFNMRILPFLGLTGSALYEQRMGPVIQGLWWLSLLRSVMADATFYLITTTLLSKRINWLPGAATSPVCEE